MDKFICRNKSDSVYTVGLDSVEYVLMPKGTRGKDSCILTQEQRNHPKIIQAENKEWIEVEPINVLTPSKSYETIIDNVTSITDAKVKKSLQELDWFLRTRVAQSKKEIDSTLSMLEKGLSGVNDKIDRHTALHVCTYFS